MTRVPPASASVSSPPVLKAEPARRQWSRAALALCGYALLGVVLTWPLALYLRTYLPGDPGGDTGVYVWNLWVFRHELLTHGHLPFSTQHIFAATGGTDFSLHNYTAVAGLLAVPLVGVIGVVGAFNLVMIAAIALSGAATCLLCRRLGLRPLAAWVAGAVFVAMPLLSARESAHLSLVITGALPLFVWALLRVLDRPTLAGGAGVGAIVALATYSDAYYGIYCALMGTVVLASRFLVVDGRARGARATRAARVLGLTALVVLGLGAAGLASGRTQLRLGPVVVRGVDEPYAPALIALVLGLASLALSRRYSIAVVDRARLRALVPPGLLAIATCLVLMAPPLVGVAGRYASGRMPQTRILWRSSPRGVDLLAYVVPNPVHALLGPTTGRWLLPPVEDAFPELIASCSLLVVGAVLVAGLRRRLPREWVGFTAVFAALSLGPFVHVAGSNTFIPGPWALLRYVPVVGMARSPSRFAIVAALGLSVLFGFVLQEWLRRGSGRARAWAAVFLAVVAVEVIPAPRTLYSAAVPDIYRFVRVADGSEQGRLLDLPTGIRDGTSSLGDFNARSAYYQTQHRRPLVGGYLSRVSERRRRDSLQSPVLHAIYALSDPNGGIDDGLARAAKADARGFLARSCVRYVMVDTERTPPALRTFVTDTLDLVVLHADGRYQLLVPESPPPCE